MNHERLEAAVLKAFSEPDPINRPQRTRAVVVVKDGWVIAERYADGIDPETPLIGWSMTKSLMHALIGIAVGDGRISLDHPVPMAEWSNIDGDPRATITPRHLLQMNTGLAFDETSRNLSSDLVTMLTQVDDMGAFAARQPLVAVPGQRWAYASGTTAILSTTLRQVINNDLSYWRFPSERLFQPLGMATAVLETDPREHLLDHHSVGPVDGIGHASASCTSKTDSGTVNGSFPRAGSSKPKARVEDPNVSMDPTGGLTEGVVTVISLETAFPPRATRGRC